MRSKSRACCKTGRKSLFLVGEAGVMKKGMGGVSLEVISLPVVFLWMWQAHSLPSSS